MKDDSVRLELRVADKLYKDFAKTSLRLNRFSRDGNKPSAILLLDFPLTWAVRELNTMSIRARSRTVVFTTAQSVAYHDAIAAFHVSGVVIPDRIMQLPSALYAAAYAMRTYARYTDLTPTELRLIRLLLSGKETEDMASEMRVSRKTINAHFSNILQKLNISSRLHIVTELLRSDLMTH